MSCVHLCANSKFYNLLYIILKTGQNYILVALYSYSISTSIYGLIYNEPLNPINGFKCYCHPNVLQTPRVPSCTHRWAPTLTLHTLSPGSRPGKLEPSS